MRRLVALAALAASVVVPAVADAKTKRVMWQQRAYVAYRVFDQIGFIPIAGIQKQNEVLRYRGGKHTYVVTWANALASGEIGLSMRNADRHRRFGSVDDGIYTDRPLRKKEKRRGWRVAIDLARDADVLVVHPGNPVCATGVTRAQAHGIANGSITSWSQVGGSGSIRRFLVGSEDEIAAFAEPRFGIKIKQPKSVVERDGGVGAAASDPSVAAVTSWSRVRYGTGGCVVPIDGVAPTNASVHALQYKPAYRVQYVHHKKRSKYVESRIRVREYLRFLRSDRAEELFVGNGLLMAGDPPPAGPGQPGPTGPDPAEPVRDDATVQAALEGGRFLVDTHSRAFDPGGVYTSAHGYGTPGCAETTGTWSVVEGHRAPDGSMFGTLLVDGTPVQVELPQAPYAVFDGVQYDRFANLPAGCD